MLILVNLRNFAYYILILIYNIDILHIFLHINLILNYSPTLILKSGILSIFYNYENANLSL